ncbi:MAG: hypothetical protein C5B49_11390 [Bdellovibrio sp.]|nr:MAG: hypothetical protein C5B49_11390 [Bdellovibrio sp.]
MKHMKMKQTKHLAILASLIFSNSILRAQVAESDEEGTVIPSVSEMERAAEQEGNADWGLWSSNFTVAPGFVAYLTYRPFARTSEGGFARTIKGPASDRYNWLNMVAVFVDVRPQTYTEAFKLQTKDQLQIPFRVHVIMHPDPDRVQELVEKYSLNWYKRWVHEPLRSIVRNSLFGNDLSELERNTPAIQAKIEKEVREKVLEGMPVILDNIQVGQFLNPQRIADAVEVKLAKQQELQQKQTELEISQKQIEIEAALGRAQSEKANSMGKSLNPLYLQYLAIQAMREFADKKGNSVVVLPISQNGMPLNLQLNPEGLNKAQEEASNSPQSRAK